MSSGYAPEGGAAVAFLLAPLVLGLVSLWPAGRGHWAALVLAAPSLLVGLAFTWALLREGAAYVGWPAIAYSFVLLAVGASSVLLWKQRRIGG